MRHIISSLALSAVILAGVAANAAEATKHKASSSTGNSAVRPYMGLDYGYLHMRQNAYNKLMPHNYNSVIPHAGLRIGNYFGVEAGYLTSLTQSKKSKYGTTKAYIQELYLDGRVYAPITKSVEAIGSVGISKYASMSKLNTPSYSGYIYQPIIRLGGGLQYNIDKNLSVRSMLNYNINTKSLSKQGVLVPTVGVNYTF